jgi:predicted heme/steroid binding protein
MEKNMIYRMGGLFGWLLVIAFAGTILNYILKFINKHWGKKISTNPVGSKLMKLLMKIFVRNHKYFGFAAGILLILHFLVQFSRFGLNLTGCLAAVLMLIQLLLGIYATAAKRPRKGLWFGWHRIIAVLLILGIALHLLMPYALSIRIRGKGPAATATSQAAGTTSQAAVTSQAAGAASQAVTGTTSASTQSSQPTFTLKELAQYNGQNGAKAYVACNGKVYDVTDVPQWNNGGHHGHVAGTDLTDVISQSPHGDSVLQNLTVVGTLQN